MPGSGTYQGDGGSIRKSAPSFGFGTSAREKDYIKESKKDKLKCPPGPGHYKTLDVIGKEGQKQSMPGRRKDLRPKSGRDAPGAGQYDPLIHYAKKKVPNYVFPKSHREASLNLAMTTPGS